VGKDAAGDVTRAATVSASSRGTGPRSRVKRLALLVFLTAGACQTPAPGIGTAGMGGGGFLAADSGTDGPTSRGGGSGAGGLSSTGGTTGGGDALGGRGAAGGSVGGGGAAGGRAGGGAGRAAGGNAGGLAGQGAAGQAGHGAGEALAFPGAVGFGRVATGGRGKAVYHVTNLGDTGPGSFRDAVGTSGRIVVFDVGGYVVLSSAVSVKSNITIAGQTAPGDGIGIMAREVSFNGATGDIVRFVRFRQGDLDPDSSKSGINLLDATTMIFDHVSIEFAQWNNIDAVGASNITVQSSIDADPIGQQFAAHTESGPYTWYRNVFANAHNRNPLAKANTEYINNIIYDFQAGYTAGNTSGTFSHDLVNNYFITGPATTSASNALYQVNTQPMYLSGNLLDSNRDGTLDGVALGVPGAAMALAAPWGPDTRSIPTLSAAAAFVSVLADAGASLHRDQVDTLVVADVQSLGKSGSLWTHQTATNLANSGYGTLAGGVPPADSDGDGMPDAWETRYGLDPHDPSDGTGDFDGTGYTNVEKYINGLYDGSYP
jgi:hypothetical protein